MKKLSLSLIRFYQKYISLDQGYLRKALFPTSDITFCRYTPTCSEYTYHAIEKYGIFTGSFKGLWRILRCNPFSKGGEDPLV